MTNQTILGTAAYPAVFAVDQNNEHVATLQPSHPRPWIRYWARFVDLVLAGAAFSIIVGSLGADVTNWNPFAFYWLTLVVWIPIEAAFVSSCGTTPGKWLFNIRLTKADRSLLTFEQALGRSIAVLIRGLGFGVPLVNFVTQIVASDRLIRQGATSWDEQFGVVVRHEKIGAARVLCIVLVFLLIAILRSQGNSMSDTTAPPAARSHQSEGALS